MEEIPLFRLMRYEFIAWLKENGGRKSTLLGSTRKQHRFGWQTIENPISKVQAKGFEEETGDSIDPLSRPSVRTWKGEK